MLSVLRTRAQTQAKLDAMNKELLKSIPGFVPAEDEGEDEETVQLMEEETKLKAELSQLKSDAAGAERAQEAENDELQGLKKRVAQLAEVTEATKSKRQKLEEEHEHSIAQMKKTQQEYDAMADRCDEKDAKKAVLLDKWQALPEDVRREHEARAHAQSQPVDATQELVSQARPTDLLASSLS